MRIQYFLRKMASGREETVGTQLIQGLLEKSDSILASFYQEFQEASE